MSMRCDGCNENKLPARVGNPVGGMRRDEIKVKKDINAFIYQNVIFIVGEFVLLLLWLWYRLHIIIRLESQVFSMGKYTYSKNR